ncbi:ABC transporter permease [Agromyces mediolanus]|uniref:ABC transporter permease n=1 Tax=Agromyces mediolanus TaxID=41986 RepID=UPI0020411383|nr:ABC transporter permease [Agromyces mediolanus]MCM3658879.1 ABC transporter permease [Agromyces mediolanus]
MPRFIAIRVLEGLATLLVSSFLIFGALYLAPGDPLSYLIGNRTLSDEAIAALREQYHLDDPFLVRWVAWLGDVLSGDLGRSITYRDDVLSLLGPRLATTTMLIAYALVVIVVIGVGLGIVAALSRRALSDVILAGTSIGVAIPSFVAASTLISVFAVGLGWFPAFGPGDGFFDRLYHLTLPVIALTLASGSYVIRVTRAALREEAARDQVKAAVARGIPRSTVIGRHILRNGLTPVATVVGLTLTSLIVGSVVVERAFALDGIGALLTEAVAKKDFGVVQAICLLLITAVVIVVLIVDVIQVVIDPRVRERQGIAA